MAQKRQISMFLDSWERDLFDGEPTKSICAKEIQVSVNKLSKTFQFVSNKFRSFQNKIKNKNI